MKKTPSRKSRRENWENFTDGNDDVTIAPYLSSAEVCRRFAPSKKKKGAAVDDSDDFFDATDLMNKGADDYRRQRRAAKAQKGRGRRVAEADSNVDINKGGKKSEKISSDGGASSKTAKTPVRTRRRRRSRRRNRASVRSGTKTSGANRATAATRSACASSAGSSAERSSNTAATVAFVR